VGIRQGGEQHRRWEAEMTRAIGRSKQATNSRPPLHLEYRSVAVLRPYGNNARTHDETQVGQIAESIRAFGFANPILVDEADTIIAGHGRLLAAKRLDMAEVPVIVLRGLTEAQRRALTLADNKIALNAGWDADLLAFELKALQDLGADLSMIGFDGAELAEIFARSSAEGLTGEDEVPPLPQSPVSRLGDTWVLGRHRVRCGDSTSQSDVNALLGGSTPMLMVTDPPYGVEYDPAWRHRLGVNHSKRRGTVLNDSRADWREAWALFRGDVAYVWHGALHAITVAESLFASGFAIRAQIVWAKERLVIGRGDYHWQHEPCWYAVRKKGHWAGDRKQTTLWTISSRGQDQETEHSTQKPVECMRRPMLNNSRPGEAVYDPFLGSGSSLIAAETTGRTCMGIELNPAYVDCALRRWELFTGQRATLEGTGQGHADVAAERIPAAA